MIVYYNGDNLEYALLSPNDAKWMNALQDISFPHPKRSFCFNCCFGRFTIIMANLHTSCAIWYKNAPHMFCVNKMRFYGQRCTVFLFDAITNHHQRESALLVPLDAIMVGFRRYMCNTLWLWCTRLNCIAVLERKRETNLMIKVGFLPDPTNNENFLKISWG